MPLNDTVDDAATDEVVVDISPAKQRKFSGSDADPVDADTGESVFDDLRNSPFRTFPEAEDEPSDVEDADAEDTDKEADELEIEDETVDDSDDDGAGPVDDTDEEDPKQVKFNKRLSRAERIANEAQAESRALRERLAKAEEKQAAEANETKYTTDKAAAKAKVDAVKTKLTEAVEAGDSGKQVELQVDLADAVADLKIVERVYTEAKLSLTKQKDESRTSTIAATKVTQWKRKHPRFNTDPKFASAAKVYEQEAFAAGLNPEQQEFFDYLDEGMARHYPKEFGKKTPVDNKKQRKHPSAQMSRDTDTRQAKSRDKDPTHIPVKNGKARLSTRHQEIMREFGLDPTNKDDVAEFVRNNK